jgi:uncharacterized protein YqgV (UPF0045/DUF77 family)
VEIGLEISLYPLQQQIRPAIHAFIERLHSDPRLRVVSNSMSTQVFGDYELIMALLTREVRATFASGNPAVCVLKLFGPLAPAEVPAGAGAGRIPSAN